MQRPGPALGRARRRHGWPTCGVLLLLVGCGPSEDAGFEQEVDVDGESGEDEPAEDRDTGDAAGPSDGGEVADDIPPTQVACPEVTGDLDGGASMLADMELLEALESVPELSRIASSFSLPRITEQLERFDEVTVFAPLDDGLPSGLVDDASENEPRAGDEDTDPLREDTEGGSDPPPLAYIGPDGAFTLDELQELDEVAIADGGTATLDVEDGRVRLQRGGNAVEIVCADVEVRDGIIHVVNGELPSPQAGTEGGVRDLGGAPEDEPAPPDVREELDELDEPGAGTP